MSEFHERPDVSLGLDEFARSVSGPPWILGARGCPLDAPENTLSGFRLALAAGLDGISYDLRVCASGEPVVMADATIDRTTDGHGELKELSLPELFPLDAGSWFSKRHAGETVPLLDEVLETLATPAHPPLQLLELRALEALPEVLTRLREHERSVTARIGVRSKQACLEIRDAGGRAVLIADRADAEMRNFVRDERITGFATSREGWRYSADDEEWPCERWGLAFDSPEDLVFGSRMFGYTTREPARALAHRALASLATELDRAPLRSPLLSIEPGGIEGVRGESSGEWAGNWRPTLELENPLPFPVHVKLGLRVRRGAFEVEGLPREFDLEPREQAAIPVHVCGGSWSPGGDPVALAILSWTVGAERSAAGQLLLEAPLVRVRTVALDGVSRRLALLRENPREREASMIAHRRGNDLLISIENPGEVEDPHTVVRVQDHTYRGGQGLRVRLPDSIGPEGVAFSCGIEGVVSRPGGHYRVLRRWAGGLPQEADSGEPGRLITAN